MKTHQILALVLVLGLLAFGQAGCQKNTTEAGTQGIVVEKIAGAPPLQASKDQQFSIMVSIENKGSYDVKKGEATVFLEGIEPSLFSLSSADLEKKNTIELREAVNAQGIAGGRERIVFADKAKYVGQNVDFNQPIKYVSCYDYESEAQTNICFALQSGEICNIDGDKIENAIIGDAPVQITSITEQRSGQNIQMRFKIENVGTGRVYSPEVNCRTPEIFLENSVLVSVESEEPFDCKPTLSGAKSGEGRVNNIIVCSRSMKDTAEHLSPVKIRLRYKYLELAETSIGITE
ncbi:MAG: hypothetical protein KJ767_03670 [Nanoarchaeota archaeon]|nr:hypothetical protein [Nanoarchaeota archaeon]